MQHPVHIRLQTHFTVVGAQPGHDTVSCSDMQRCWMSCLFAYMVSTSTTDCFGYHARHCVEQMCQPVACAICRCSAAARPASLHRHGNTQDGLQTCVSVMSAPLCCKAWLRCVQSQKLQGKTSITRSGTMQSRTEKACLDVLSRLDADLPLSAIQGETCCLQALC